MEESETLAGARLIGGQLSENFTPPTRAHQVQHEHTHVFAHFATREPTLGKTLNFSFRAGFRSPAVAASMGDFTSQRNSISISESMRVSERSC